MPNFIGFDGTQKAQMLKVHNVAKQCLKNTMNCAFNDNDKYMQRLKTYFSSFSGQDSQVSSLVMKTINSMQLAMDMGVYDVHLKAQVKGTNAQCASWQQDSSLRGTTTDWIPKGIAPLPSGATEKLVNVLEAQIDYSSKHGASIMSIYPSALDQEMWKLDAQCQVETYLHELSHCAAGTVDVSDNGINPYGSEGVNNCKQLGGRSAQNAENIAFFISSFH